jgi:uncharacterized membrane protein AbrB (regulator of aidB expression)
MLFGRTLSLFTVIVATALTGWLMPSAHWPASLWLPALLVAIFVIGPFMIALDIREGRRASQEDAPEISGS